jgi:hypothetical protein
MAAASIAFVATVRSSKNKRRLTLSEWAGCGGFSRYLLTAALGNFRNGPAVSVDYSAGPAGLLINRGGRGDRLAVGGGVVEVIPDGPVQATILRLVLGEGRRRVPVRRGRSVERSYHRGRLPCFRLGRGLTGSVHGWAPAGEFQNGTSSNDRRRGGPLMLWRRLHMA